jgi:hypothetical protein
MPPEWLDDSTTDTSFLWIGPEPPGITTRLVAETASARDRKWFEEHHDHSYRVRWSLPGEFNLPVESLIGRPISIDLGRYIVVVLQLSEGVRRRMPLLFIEGEHTKHPIPEEIWPIFHETAIAPDQEAAIRQLGEKMLQSDGEGDD